VQSEPPAALVDALADQREPGGVVDARRDPPADQCDDHDGDGGGETEERERAAHARETGQDEPPRAERVREDAARQGADPEQRVPDADDQPQRRGRDRELVEPGRHQDRDGQLVGVDHRVPEHHQRDDGPVVVVHT